MFRSNECVFLSIVHLRLGIKSKVISEIVGGKEKHIKSCLLRGIVALARCFKFFDPVDGYPIMKSKLNKSEIQNTSERFHSVQLIVDGKHFACSKVGADSTSYYSHKLNTVAVQVQIVITNLGRESS